MGKIFSLRMGARQILGFGAILTLMVGISLFSGWEVNQIDRNLTTMIDQNSATQRFAINFRGSVHDRAIAIRDIVLVDADDVQKEVDLINSLEQFYADSALKMDNMFKNPENVREGDEALLQGIKQAEKETQPLIAEVIRLTRAGQIDEAKKFTITKARPAFINWLAAINAFIDAKERENQIITTETRSISQGFLSLVFIVCGISVLIGVIFAWWNIRSANILHCVTEVILKLAKGDLNAQFPCSSSGDEIEDIMNAAVIFRDNMKKSQAMAEREIEETRLRSERSQRIEQMTNTFDSDISALLEVMSKASGEMQETAGTMSNIADTSTCKTSMMVESAQKTAVNVENVVLATEKLTGSINEIKLQVGKSSQIADRAVQQADHTDTQVQGLSEAALRIGEVVKIISDIAEQTNLLALNATIEAARAGDAGRGFAVVASEVKQLASQTANATSEISQQISAIQEETRDAVNAIQSIGTTIKEVNEITSKVVSAVEQQNEATDAISNNVAQVADATQEVTQNMEDLANVASDTDNAANQVTGASAGLSEQTKLVKSQVESFLVEVKVA